MLADRSFDRLDASGSTSGRGGGSPRPARSTWPHSPDYDPDIELFARIRVGLITGEHRLRLNDATFLFLYLHSTCYFTGPQAGTSVATYTHVAAAKHLEASTRQVRRWMQTLLNGGYVTTVRVNQGLVVTITRYGQLPVSGVGQADTSGHFVASNASEQADTSGKQADTGGKQADTGGKQADTGGHPLIYVARALRDSEISETPPPLPLWSPIFFGALRFPAGALRFPDLLMQPVPPVCPDFRRPNPQSSPSRSRQPSAFP